VYAWLELADPRGLAARNARSGTASAFGVGVLSTLLVIPKARSTRRPAAAERQPDRGEADATRSSTKRLFKTLAVGASVVALCLGLWFGSRHLNAGDALPFGLIQVSGRIEGDSTIVASKQPGSLKLLVVREGDVVEAGQVVARLDDAMMRARLERALATRDVARAELARVHAELVVPKREVSLNVATARAALETAQAGLEQANAVEAQAAREQERIARLADAGSVDRASLERVDLALETARQELRRALAMRRQAEQALASARLGPARVHAKEASIALAEANVRQADAAVAEAEAALADLTLVAPVSGTVVSRFVNGGEVVSAGAPLLELVDMDRLYLKAFVPEVLMGKVRLGLAARIHVDAFPSVPIPAEVRYIAPRAEFTPKEVQTADERVKLVHATKLYVRDNRERRLTPGVSADAVIRWREDAPWSPPRW
jgi:HlyD family secretion protein